MEQRMADFTHEEIFDMACEIEDYWMSRIRNTVDEQRPIFRGIVLQSFIFERLLKNNIHAKMVAEDRFFPILPLPRDTTESKEVRIRGLVPRAAANGILFNEELRTDPMMQLAKTQYLDFPTGAHDDFPDALSHINKIFFRVRNVDDVKAADEMVSKTSEELRRERVKSLIKADQKKAFSERVRQESLATWLGYDDDD